MITVPSASPASSASEPGPKRARPHPDTATNDGGSGTPATQQRLGSGKEPAYDNEGCRPVDGHRSAHRREPIPSFIAAIHGRIGDRVYKTYRRPGGRVRIVVTRVPDFTGYEPTAAQKFGRVPFRFAISDHLAGHPLVPEQVLASKQIPQQPLRSPHAPHMATLDTDAYIPPRAPTTRLCRERKRRRRGTSLPQRFDDAWPGYIAAQFSSGISASSLLLPLFLLSCSRKRGLTTNSARRLNNSVLNLEPSRITP